MKNDESSHELENNTNDFAIRMLYILRHTLFFEGGNDILNLFDG